MRIVRVFDLLVTGVLLLVLVPVVLWIAVAVKLDTRGPVFFHARRVGYRGRVFHMVKFRKMHVHARGPGLTVADDHRLTSVGSFLARSKLDEVPQLWNVLRGHMSLVGPRPEAEEYVAIEADAYDSILAVPPGITGLSQLAYRREPEILDPEDRRRDYVTRILPQKIRLDLLYAERRSVRLNLRILLWTVLAVAGIDVAVHRGTGRLNRRRRA
jgi:lipopolysaccharide/colanic/teichoic acid biosynthesis glycosyltransferase